MRQFRMLPLDMVATCVIWQFSLLSALNPTLQKTLVAVAERSNSLENETHLA
jgi:hypothetical protein